MARPGPPFPTLPDYVRAELRSFAASSPVPPKIASRPADDDEEDDDERDLPIPTATVRKSAIPRSLFGRSDDEITRDFGVPGQERPRPRASQPPNESNAPPVAPARWQPLSDDEATGEALLASLRRQENSPEGEPGPGGPGLN
jgi:hypothetical protein